MATSTTLLSSFQKNKLPFTGLMDDSDRIDREWSDGSAVPSASPEEVLLAVPLDSNVKPALPRSRGIPSLMSLQGLNLSQPMSWNREDAADPSASLPGQVRPDGARGRSCCCAEDSFWARFWSRMKLDHLVADNAPGYLLLKAALVIILALLIDKGTRNPDSSTSVFIGLLGLANYLAHGVESAKQTLVSGLLGAFVGTGVAAATWLPPATDPGRWMLLLSVPWSVVTTMYLMFFFALDSPPSMATGMFGSLFVVLVPFVYPPIDNDVPITDPRRVIWQTLLVRVIALLTGVASAFIVNMVVSATAPLAIYRMSMFFSERLVWRSQKHRLEPTDRTMQLNFQRVVNQIALAPVVSTAADTWIFSQATRDEIAVIHRRSRAMFRFLTLRSYLELYLQSVDPAAEERNEIIRLIEMSKRNAQGGSLLGKTVQEEIQELNSLPEYLYVEKTILQDILQELSACIVSYRPAPEQIPFMGRI